MMSAFRRLGRDDQGVAILELALAAPMLALLVIGIVDISNAYSRKLTLEQAAQRGIEKIMQTTDDDTVDTTIVTEVAAAAGVPQNKVNLEFWLECNNVRQGDFTSDCVAGQFEARYIRLTINDEFEPMFPVKFGANQNGKYPMTVKVGMRTR